MDQDRLDFCMSLVQVPHWEQVKTLFETSSIHMVKSKSCLLRIKGFASSSTKVKPVGSSTRVFLNSFSSGQLHDDNCLCA